MPTLDVATKFKFASEAMAGVLSRFSFATAAEKQLKHTKRCKKHCLTGLNLGNDDSISSKVIRTQT